MKVYSFILLILSIFINILFILFYKLAMINSDEIIIANFLIYLCILIAVCLYLKYNNTIIILNPLFATLIAFGFSFYLPSITDKFTSTDGFMTYTKENIVKTIILASCSLISLISGFLIYEFIFKERFNNFIIKRTKIKTSNSLNIFNFYFILILLTGLRVYSIVNGTYGYSANQDMIENAPIYANIINTFAGFGDSLFILVTIVFISKIHIKFSLNFIFYFLFIIQITFGILSGFKGGIIFPFFNYLIIFYLIKGKINYKFIILLFFGLVFSFFLIEPYRQLKKVNPDFKITSISFSEYQDMYNNFDIRGFFNNDENIIIKYIFRKNLLQTSAAGINYYENHNEILDKDSPEFLSKIFLSPFLTFIPRFLWKTKPINLDGLWYSNEVLSIPYYTFSPPGKIIYLYFAGGLVLLISGFIFIGIFHGILVSFVNSSITSFFSIFIFFYFYDMSISLEQSYDYFLIGIFQAIFVLIVINKFIIKKF
jgi:hypothetical protein